MLDLRHRGVGFLLAMDRKCDLWPLELLINLRVARITTLHCGFTTVSSANIIGIECIYYKEFKSIYQELKGG